MTNRWETSVSLSSCKYDKQRRTLCIAYKDLPVHFKNENKGGGFPAGVFIHSEKTGRVIYFAPVGPNDRLYSEDHWDGEQQIYRPNVALDTVDHLVIHYG